MLAMRRARLAPTTTTAARSIAAWSGRRPCVSAQCRQRQLPVLADSSTLSQTS
jgi:hypothetical protein